jgi:hypothetical protein
MTKISIFEGIHETTFNGVQNYMLITNVEIEE